MHSKECSQLADCFSALHHVITQHSNECPLPAGNTLRHFTVRVKKIMVLIIKKFINSPRSQVPDGLRLSFSNLPFLVPSALMLVRPVNRLSLSSRSLRSPDLHFTNSSSFHPTPPSLDHVLGAVYWLLFCPILYYFVVILYHLIIPLSLCCLNTHVLPRKWTISFDWAGSSSVGL